MDGCWCWRSLAQILSRFGLGQKFADFISLGLVGVQSQGAGKIGQSLLGLIKVIKIYNAQVFEYLGKLGIEFHSTLEIRVCQLEIFL